MIEKLMSKRDCKVIRMALLRTIFPSLTIALSLFLITFLLSIIAISYGSLFVILTLMSFMMGFVAFLILSSKLRKDLSAKKTILEEGIITSKTHKIDYEPGSVTFPVTILSFLTPKIFKRDMKEMNIYSVLIGNMKFELTKEDYDKAEEGKEIYIKRALYSNLFLGLEKLS